MRSTSYRPKKPPITEPTTTPITGAQRRNTPVAFSAMPLMMSSVTRAFSGAASAGVPGADSRLKMAGIIVIGISMITVPTIVGVRSRWNRESRQESTRGTKDEMATRVASIAGPPSTMAVIHTAIKAPEVPISST